MYAVVSPSKPCRISKFLFAHAVQFRYLLGQVKIFHVIQIFQNGLAGVKGFAATSAFSKIVEPLVNFLRQAYDQHN